MRAIWSIGLSLLAIQLGVPRWAGDAQAGLPVAGPMALSASRVALDPRRPSRTRLGALTYMGGVVLEGRKGAFGGYSALAVRGDAFTLLSDRGAVLHFRMGSNWQPRDGRVTPLAAGPGTGWVREDRDAEGMALEPSAGRVRISFERHNQIWTYCVLADGRWQAERGYAPAAMADWPSNGGAESIAWLPDGRFLVLSEGRRPPDRSGGRQALIFAGDPTLASTPVARFTYLPEPGLEPVDAAALPDGRLLVLERSFGFPNRWANRLALVPAGAIRVGAVVRGRTIARLERPLLIDNFEGLAVTKEARATMLWLVSDDNTARWQRTLLLKFRLEG